MGDVAGGLLPAIPQATAPGPGVGLDAVGGSSEIADRSREGPFDIHRDHPRSVASPQLLQDTQGCLFLMTSYDVQSDGPNFAPEHGVQLHDPRFLEYVGAPQKRVSPAGRAVRPELSTRQDVFMRTNRM